MKVIVDTSVWSLALRRDSPVDDSRVIACRRLIVDGRVAMLGPIRQEVLSGIRHRPQFEKLRSCLSAFPDLSLETRDWESAAECFNVCRSRGIQGANTDFLICAVAMRTRYEILSSDNDFIGFGSVLPIRRYDPST